MTFFFCHFILFSQKERDYNKELKRKNEEMKAKIFSLRNHKMELDRKILEMLSSIDSLKDEQRTLEAAFEEKQNEIKLLKVTDSAIDKVNSDQVMALTQSLKQKEAEIEALKHHIPAKDCERVMIGQIESENKTNIGAEDNKEIKKTETLQDQTINYGDNKNEKPIHIDDQVNEKNQNGNLTELEKLGNSQLGGQEVLLGNSKVENLKSSVFSTSTMREKHGSVIVAKGNRRRSVAKNNRKLEQQGNSRINELTNMKKRRFFKVKQSGLKGRANRAASEVKELGKHADKNDFFGESSSRLEEDKEEYKEEIDESEFN